MFQSEVALNVIRKKIVDEVMAEKDDKRMKSNIKRMGDKAA